MKTEDAVRIHQAASSLEGQFILNLAASEHDRCMRELLFADAEDLQRKQGAAQQSHHFLSIFHKAATAVNNMRNT